MIIDKGWGYWNLKNSTIFDDIAYYLFVQYYVHDYKDSQLYMSNMEYEPPNQKWFYFRKLYYEKYYNKANIILRKEKLNKINETIIE